MTNNVQDLLYCLRERPIMADCDQAADLLEKLAALPEKFDSRAEFSPDHMGLQQSAYRDCAHDIEQIFTEVLGNDNTR